MLKNDYDADSVDDMRMMQITDNSKSAIRKSANNSHISIIYYEIRSR